MSVVWSFLRFTKVNRPGEPQTRPAKSGVVLQVLRKSPSITDGFPPSGGLLLKASLRDEIHTKVRQQEKGTHSVLIIGLSERGSHEFLAHIFSFPCMTHGPGLVQSEKMLLGPGLFVMACAHHGF